MVTVFFKENINAESKTIQFPSLEEAREWVKVKAKKSCWFSAQHISRLNVTEMPLYLVLSYENGQYMRRLHVIEESKIYKDTVVIAPAPQGLGLKAGQDIGAFSSNGSVFSAGSSKYLTYIDIFQPQFATLAYVLLGPCERSIEGVDYALANALMAKKPELNFEFSHEAELNKLKYGRHKIVTKAMRCRMAELEAEENSARVEFRTAQNQAFKAWYASVMKACACV